MPKLHSHSYSSAFLYLAVHYKIYSHHCFLSFLDSSYLEITVLIFFSFTRGLSQGKFRLEMLVIHSLIFAEPQMSFNHSNR